MILTTILAGMMSWPAASEVQAASPAFDGARPAFTDVRTLITAERRISILLDDEGVLQADLSDEPITALHLPADDSNLVREVCLVSDLRGDCHDIVAGQTAVFVVVFQGRPHVVLVGQATGRSVSQGGPP